MISIFQSLLGHCCDGKQIIRGDFRSLKTYYHISILGRGPNPKLEQVSGPKTTVLTNELCQYSSTVNFILYFQHKVVKSYYCIPTVFLVSSGKKKH